MSRALRTLAAAAAAAACLAAAAPDDEPARGWQFAALPLVNYSSDEGFGYGLRGAAYLRDPDLQPYRLALVLQAFFTTGGVQSHLLRIDAPRAFGSRWRLDGVLGLRRELFAPYYGPGNRSPAGPGGDDLEPVSFDRRTPRLVLNGRYAFGGPVAYFLGLRLRDTRIDAYRVSVAAREQPFGIDGGRTTEVTTGVVWDSRDLEADPGAGWFSELSIRAADRALGGDFDYGGVNLTDRRFITLYGHTEGDGRRVVLALRSTLDVMFGDVPFFELSSFGGSGDPISGVGGVDASRGLPKNRYVGEVKALVTPELRARLLTAHPGRNRFDLSAVAALDVGRVWSEDVDDGPFWRWHPAGIGGLRLAWNNDFMVRADFAVSGEGNGLYVVFDHIF